VATGPDLRIADADREAAAARLREHYAQGRLTLEEFHQRLDAVFAATTQSQLSALTRDLPRAPSAPLPVTNTAASRERARREHQPGPRAWLGLIPVIVAALTAWLLIFGLHLWMFSWPGMLGIFMVIFAAARWLMRRIWRFGRGACMGGGRYRSRR
jgi:uncharacterized membrane protein